MTGVILKFPLHPCGKTAGSFGYHLKKIVMKIYKLFVGIILSFCALGTTSIFAQSGDQILDGIGETGLIARYTFNGDVKDWSRNNLHGSIQGTDFKVLYQNKVHVGLVGDHIGEYCYEAYEKRGDICESCPVAKSFEDGEVHKAERTAPTDKGTLYVDITASPLKDSNGKIIAGIEIARDITENKRIAEKLKASEERLYKYLDTLPIGIFVLNSSRTPQYANIKAEQILREDWIKVKLIKKPLNEDEMEKLKSLGYL